MAFSRLVHPTTLGFRYAARIRLDEQGQVLQAYPAEILGMGREAWLSPSQKRDWLTAEELNIVAELLKVAPTSIPRRVSNALWYLDYASRTYYLDLRWTLVCTGLEALAHTDRNRSIGEFRSRIPQMAAELGIAFSPDQGEQAYHLRSTLAHGESFLSGVGGPPQPEHVA